MVLTPALDAPRLARAVPLSLDRAESTRNYLTARGVSGARIQVDGRGSREPIAGNDTAAGRARNRRVEIFMGERQG